MQVSPVPATQPGGDSNQPPPTNYPAINPPQPIIQQLNPQQLIIQQFNPPTTNYLLHPGLHGAGGAGGSLLDAARGHFQCHQGLTGGDFGVKTSHFSPSRGPAPTGAPEPLAQHWGGHGVGVTVSPCGAPVAPRCWRHRGDKPGLGPGFPPSPAELGGHHTVPPGVTPCASLGDTSPVSPPRAGHHGAGLWGPNSILGGAPRATPRPPHALPPRGRDTGRGTGAAPRSCRGGAGTAGAPPGGLTASNSAWSSSGRSLVSYTSGSFLALGTRGDTPALFVTRYHQIPANRP